MDFKEYLKEKSDFDKNAEKSAKENHMKYSWEVMIGSDKKVVNQFEKELERLFKKYTNKTTDGYIKKLPTKK